MTQLLFTPTRVPVYNNSYNTYQKTSIADIPLDIPKKYRALNIVGKGGYGKVFSAQNCITNDTICIKKLENVFRHPIEAKRAIREVKLLKQLNHENLLKIYDLFMDTNFKDLYIVSELLDTDLHKVIYSSQPLMDEHAQYFTYQILKSLLYLHSAGVIHRDLKPANVFLDLNCEIRIGDLGMSRIISNVVSNDMHLTEYVATRWYRAPEIMMWQAYGFEVDIWSVGCILCELLCRKPLFMGNNLLDQLKKIFLVLGKPKDDFLRHIQDNKIKQFIQNLNVSNTGLGIKNCLPKNINPLAVDLVSKLLIYSPYKRMSVVAALQHPYFRKFHKNKNMLGKMSRINYPSYIENSNMIQLKNIILNECNEFKKLSNYYNNKMLLNKKRINNNYSNNNNIINYYRTQQKMMSNNNINNNNNNNSSSNGFSFNNLTKKAKSVYSSLLGGKQNNIKNKNNKKFKSQKKQQQNNSNNNYNENTTLKLSESVIIQTDNPNNVSPLIVSPIIKNDNNNNIKPKREMMDID